MSDGSLIFDDLSDSCAPGIRLGDISTQIAEDTKGLITMKHKRLNRDGWGFQYYPYYQMRIDHELFHGTACLIRLTDGEENYRV